MVTQLTQKERAAFHEAGHAVLAFRFRIPFDQVSIVGNGSGSTAFRNQKLEGMEKVVSYLELCYAGGCSEARRVFAKGAKVHVREIFESQQCKEDMDCVRECMANLMKAGVMFHEDKQLFIDWVSARTMAHIIRHWSAIEKVAKSLLEKGNLTYAECQEILGNDD